ncbi:carbonic anhydrase family protein [Rhodoferax sp.]|uniref:carbonic anhydrase n=1 Tax=Rhodoferax sp. TaxID=50421 RepID=UPI00263863B1|nr:carbonic anhydrase family protein [Rhodoferax sp.]MDD2809316.1 carbonic anhydrase family protein [Rhodoferax sp.]MDD4944397.1 carbonic anhydrase family protein [Rhodoferax sp.]
MNAIKNRLCLTCVVLPLSLGAAVGQAALCDSGQRQSPINITTAALNPHKLPALRVTYPVTPLTLANDGHTLRVRFGRGGELVLGSERYALQQFHFHTPGGDQINGEAFPFAAHILHKSASGQLLAIVVPYRLGAENPLLSKLLPVVPTKVDGNHRLPQLSVSAQEVLPAQLGYYRYTGSLTAAPCTEGVQWLVMKQPQTLSSAQLGQWQKRFKDNMRAINPLHDRPVFESD